MQASLSILAVLGFLLLSARPGMVEASRPQQSSACDLYVDNNAGSNGDGSAAHPWTNIPRSLSLSPGETVCVRGNTGATGRVYSITTITLASSGTASAAVTLRSLWVLKKRMM